VAGRSMKLTLDMPPIARVQLFQRTVENWSERVNQDELRTAITERLKMPLEGHQPLSFGAPHPAFGMWILGNWHKVVEGPLHWVWRPTPTIMSRGVDSNDILIGAKTLTTFCFNGVGVTDWNHPETMVFMCLATYRVLVERAYGFISGLDHNITIAGAIATCVNLNVRVQE